VKERRPIQIRDLRLATTVFSENHRAPECVERASDAAARNRVMWLPGTQASRFVPEQCSGERTVRDLRERPGHSLDRAERRTILMPDPANEFTPMPRAGLIPDPEASPTEQILGVAAQPDQIRASIDPKWHRFYDKLLAARDKFIDSATELQDKAMEVKHDAAQDEPAEIGSEGFHRDQLLGMVTFDQETLEEINEAISRLQNGTYGICQLTQQSIPEERLEVVPWTRYSVEARQEMEARGKTSQVAIGPLGGLEERGVAPAGPWRNQEGSI